MICTWLSVVHQYSSCRGGLLCGVQNRGCMRVGNCGSDMIVIWMESNSYSRLVVLLLLLHVEQNVHDQTGKFTISGGKLSRKGK